jgi:uncharacterized protein
MTDSSFTAPVRSSLPALLRSSQLPFTLLRVCLYLILGQGITYVLSRVARFFLTGGLSPISPQLLLASDLVALAGVLSASWIMSRLEQRNVGEYGLPARGAFGKLFWQGVLFGLAEISAVIGALAALGHYHFGAFLIEGSALFRWTVFWAILFLFVGLYEEFAFRGYVQFTLAQGITFWPAAVFLSIMFGAQHLGNPGETWTGIAGIVLAGLFWCFTLRRTGSLWLAVGMHAAFDFGETFLYSVPDSGVLFPGHLSNATLAGPAWLTGGTAGPEASIFDFLVLLLFFYGFDRWHPANRKTIPVPGGTEL